MQEGKLWTSRSISRFEIYNLKETPYFDEILL